MMKEKGNGVNWLKAVRKVKRAGACRTAIGGVMGRNFSKTLAPDLGTVVTAK